MSSTQSERDSEEPLRTCSAEYKGVPVPEALRATWNQPEACWWRAGVRDSGDALHTRGMPYQTALCYSWLHHAPCDKPIMEIDGRDVLSAMVGKAGEHECGGAL